jgi:hypothetical protein
MWGKTGILVVLTVVFAAFGNSPAKALLVDGSYRIELTGELIVPSPGTFDVSGGTVQNFTMDLLRNNDGPDRFSTYSVGSTLVTVNEGTMFEGNIMNTWGAPFEIFDTISFFTDGTWVCAGTPDFLCFTNSFPLNGGDGGNYTISPTVSAVPLPAAVWLFLSALGGLGLFGWRKRRTAA